MLSELLLLLTDILESFLGFAFKKHQFLYILAFLVIEIDFVPFRYCLLLDY